MRRWINYARGGFYYAGLVELPEVPDEEHPPRLIREHPIAFSDVRESDRAIARLNAARQGFEDPVGDSPILTVMSDSADSEPPP